MLQMIRFPLGGYTKQAIRDFAAERGFAFAKKPDSQDICFAVPDESCGETLRKAAQLPPAPADLFTMAKPSAAIRGFISLPSVRETDTASLWANLPISPKSTLPPAAWSWSRIKNCWPAAVFILKMSISFCPFCRRKG